MRDLSLCKYDNFVAAYGTKTLRADVQSLKQSVGTTFKNAIET